MKGRRARKGVRNRFLTAGSVFARFGGHGTTAASCHGGYVYHVLNRANAGMPIFEG